MPDATIIIPIGPGHMQIAQRAIDSAQRQTWETTVITAYDKHGRGPGRARNMAMQMVRTNFVIFLDADDWISSDYVAKTLRKWKAGHYVYTDWWEGDVHHSAPACPWLDGKWHVLTSLIPTNAVRTVEFDETLPGAEDTDFYNGLTRAGTCGIHLNEPLFHYGSEGVRASNFVNSPAYTPTMRSIYKKHEGKTMGCCGGGESKNMLNNPGERQEGDVEVVAIWAGNRCERGKITGRNSPRVGNGQKFWCHPADAAVWMSKNMVVPVISDEVPRIKPLKGVREVGALLYGNTFDMTAFTVPDVEITPDVGRVLELYGKAAE